MAMLDQVPTLPARFGVGQAMYCGRYGIETVSYTAPAARSVRKEGHSPRNLGHFRRGFLFASFLHRNLEVGLGASINHNSLVLKWDLE